MATPVLPYAVENKEFPHEHTANGQDAAQDYA